MCDPSKGAVFAVAPILDASRQPSPFLLPSLLCERLSSPDLRGTDTTRIENGLIALTINQIGLAPQRVELAAFLLRGLFNRDSK